MTMKDDLIYFHLFPSPFRNNLLTINSKPPMKSLSHEICRSVLWPSLDLYKATPGKNHSGVLGLAWVGGMCKGNYSCTINEAPNFEASFVIAHELGHSLGIMHDGQRNRCDPNGFIMSERTGAGKIHWSRCSNSYLNESIQSGQLKCLDTEQNGQIDSLYDLSKLRAPGQVYTINDQCRLAFGSNHTSFVTHEHPFNVSAPLQRGPLFWLRKLLSANKQFS